MGVKNFLSHPSLKISVIDFRNFFACEPEIALAKNPENLIKFYSIEVGQNCAFYMLTQCPVAIVNFLETESIPTLRHNAKT